MKAGRFRQDLCYRLRVIELAVLSISPATLYRKLAEYGVTGD